MKGHPKAGQPTFFVEKIWKSLLDADERIADYIYEVGRNLGNYQYADEVLLTVDNSIPKHHTIRGGKRYKTGDKVSLRIWSDKPYRSKQIIIAPDMEILVKDIDINEDGDIYINGKRFVHHEIVAENDGLQEYDFIKWFEPHLPFSGQIIVWNNKTLNY